MSKRQGALEDFRLRHGNKIAVAIVLSLAAVMACAMLFTNHPWRSPNFGFGPDWECTPSQTGGDPICFKKGASGSN